MRGIKLVTTMNHRNLIRLLTLAILLLLSATPTWAASEPEFAQAVADLAAKSRMTVRDGVQKLGGMIDHPQALPVLQALRDGELRVDQNGRVLIRIGENSFRDPVSGETLSGEGLNLDSPRLNNAVRRALNPAIARLQLFAEDTETRLAAAVALSRRPQEEAEGDIRQALAKESDPRVREALELALAQLDLSSPDRERRLAAIKSIGEAANMRFRPHLEQLLSKDAEGDWLEPDPEVRAAARQALSAIETRQFMVSQAGNLFYGLSLGSVLLLAALGLAITFGVMGVINMAHGEMLMLGAYATYTVQSLFKTWLPDLFDWYLLAAVPAAFMVSAVVGIVLERTVIRHLYGRPLETLLATWGIALILIQTVRMIFGAQNVEVANPGWLSGGLTITPGLVLPYNRIATIMFAVLVVGLIWALFQRTRLGLQVRAVTQNRSMAACMGIPTSRVDMWTFGLGSGVAGLGGVALSQLGNVGPELGQAYIVDSFLVVVLGGVGKLAGAVVGALGLGMINKFLEPMTGAVLGKIMVLGFIILFIQKRPQGIFALRGRAVES